MVNLTKAHKHFNHAFEAWTGSLWDWEINGKLNHPMNSGNKEIIAFYIGFNYAKKGQGEILSQFNRLKRIEKDLEKFKKDFTKFKEL